MSPNNPQVNHQLSSRTGEKAHFDYCPDTLYSFCQRSDATQRYLQLTIDVSRLIAHGDDDGAFLAAQAS